MREHREPLRLHCTSQHLTIRALLLGAATPGGMGGLAELVESRRKRQLAHAAVRRTAETEIDCAAAVVSGSRRWIGDKVALGGRRGFPEETGD